MTTAAPRLSVNEGVSPSQSSPSVTAFAAGALSRRTDRADNQADLC
jgi:hypothetical protein